jgi:WD40 repeat protein
MKIGQVLFVCVLIGILAACSGPVVIPADLPVTWPANQNFVISATVPPPATPTVGPGTPLPPTWTLTPTPTLTPTFTPSPTLTPTSTWTPVPTHKSQFPAAQNTPIVDMGFQEISLENLPKLTAVFEGLESTPRHAAMSRDGQKLFLTSSTGLFVFDRAGTILAHWKNIFTAKIACESCISINRDGSRLAVMTRNAGKWEAQVYDVAGDQATLRMALPVSYNFANASDEASIAISPDGKFLAFGAETAPLRVLDLETKLQLLSYNRRVDGVIFTPDSANLIIHGGKELLFYSTQSWKYPVNNLLLPREDTPYTLSPNSKLLAIALPTKMRIYSIEQIEKLQNIREINVLPLNALTREWQIAFRDDKTLFGYAIRWNTNHIDATVDTGEWDIESGATLRLDTVTNTVPAVLSTFWGAPLTLPIDKGNLEPGAQEFNAFRFGTDWMLLINTPHSSCWFKLDTAEATCAKDPDHILFATDGGVLKQVIEKYNTSLQDQAGKTIIQVGPRRFVAVNRTGEWALIDTGKGTDLYTKGKKLPQESIEGNLQAFSENAKLIVITTLAKENTYFVTLIDKSTGNATFQDKNNFMLKPLLMALNGNTYYFQRDVEKNQTIIKVVDPTTHETSELTRISLPTEPKAVTLSSTDLFAIGLKDGSVVVMTKDGTQTATFQAATSSISGLSFNPSGHFLAVASEEGIRVFAVLP